MNENGISSNVSGPLHELKSNESSDDIAELRQKITLLDEKLKDKDEQLDKAGKVGLEVCENRK